MHTEMWEHPATQANVATLRRRGALVDRARRGPAHRRRHRQGPASRSPAEIFEVARDVLARAGTPTPDLAGRHVVVSAGGTREHLDPVRFLGNRSSGLQGYALARAAAARGAEVTLVAANVALPDPAGVKVVHVETTARAARRRARRRPDADAVVMAAAPADFRPADGQRHQDQEGRRRLGPGVGSSRTPTSSPSSPTTAARPGAGDRRLRRRDRRRRRLGARPGPRQAGPQGLRPAGRQRRQRRQVFGSADNEAVVLDADGGATRSRAAPRPPSPTWSGTGSAAPPRDRLRHSLPGG